MSTDTMTVERPAGMTDARWMHLQSVATLIATGHMAWCQRHNGKLDADGWCAHEFRVLDTADVVLHNGTNDGSVSVGIYFDQGVNENELTVQQIAALGAVLETVHDTAKMGNT